MHTCLDALRLPSGSVRVPRPAPTAAGLRAVVPAPPGAVARHGGRSLLQPQRRRVSRAEDGDDARPAARQDRVQRVRPQAVQQRSGTRHLARCSVPWCNGRRSGGGGGASPRLERNSLVSCISICE